jgi:hypothetical protein
MTKPRWNDEYLFHKIQEATVYIDTGHHDPGGPDDKLDQAIRDYLVRLHDCYVKHHDPGQDKIELGNRLTEEGQYFIADGKRRQREQRNR